jgi:phenylpyruvate tautomerase PptA (4-oxalocrotonate tautomerase family)
MPLIEVKVFEDELKPEQTKDLIRRITDAVTTVTSEKLRDVTWVIVNNEIAGRTTMGTVCTGTIP